MAPFDMNWTPALENKLSTQIDGQLPDFIAEDHPQFSRFLRSYYQFLESVELQVTVNIDNILLQTEAATNLLNEDGTLIVTEAGSGSTGKFIEGETITGGTSYATAKVLIEDLGNATPRLFISSQQLFETGETITGATSGASGVVKKYRANPVQNIQQLLAYADIDNTIYDFIEEFRKAFMNGIPSNLASGIDKRNLEKHIGELYRRKGTKEGAKLFMRILLDESAEVFYPNQYMLKSSAADWDKPTVIRCSSSGDVVADDLIGQSVTGQNSLTTALVENSTTFAVAGGISYVEFQISNVVGTFEVGETLYGISSSADVRYNFVINKLLSSTTIANDGTLYQDNDTLDLDTAVALGSGDISAAVEKVERGSVTDVKIDDAGTKYEIGDLVVFTDNSNESGLIHDAKAEVAVIHGSIINETDSDTILQEEGTNSFIELFNFQLEEGTIVGEEPYAVYGTDSIYNAAIGYYYPIYLTHYAAEQSTVTKASAVVNGATFASTAVTVDGNAGGTLAIGMIVKANSISLGTTVTVTAVTSQTSITLSSAQTLLDNETLVFESVPTAVRTYNFVEYPDIKFYSPTADTVAAAASYSTSTYTLYGGNFNYRQDHLYSESGNAASYSGGVNTEPVFGDRLESEWAVNQTSLDTNRYVGEGFMLESGSGDITKITVTDGGDGYGLLPTALVRSKFGTSAKVLATSTNIGRIASINVINPGFNYIEAPSLEPRANFVIKDISGTFAAGDVLTSHTGTVRAYDSTTQVLTVSIEDTTAIGGEQVGATPTEGMLLEDSLTTNAYIDDNLITDGDLAYGENLVDADGNRILVDAFMARTDYILLEDDFGELIMEYPEVRLSTLTLESGTGDSGVLITEDYDYVVSEDEETELPFEYDMRQIKFVLETSAPDNTKTSVGDFILLDADVDKTEDLVLNGTDSSSSNAGEKIIFNAYAAAGVGDPSNLIVHESGTTGFENGEVLQETQDDDFTNLVLEGTNSDKLHGLQKILYNDGAIDFSSDTVSITTSGASATIVHADIARAEFSLGAIATSVGTFGGIEHLISEELIRIQDSYYYQDFSYEIQTNSGGNAYLNELKKSIHPAGFNVFAKVVQTSSVSVKVETAGSDLGTTDYDADTYSAILASTFTTLFTEAVQRRLGVRTEEEFEILLESSVVQRDRDQFILETATGEGFVQLETPENAYPDFEAIEITHGVGAGEYGILITEADDRVVSERAEAITNNIVIDGTEPGHLATSQGDAGSDILLDGTDSDSTNAGDSMEVEDSIQNGTSFMLGENQTVVHNLLDETDSMPFVYDGKADLNRDVFVRSSITTKLTATLNKTHNTSNGLVFLATTAHEGITGDGIMLELGAGQYGSRLLLTGTTDLSSEGKPQQDNGDHMLLEDYWDNNVSQSVTIDTFTTIATENLVDETDGDNLILENPVGFQGGGAIMGDDFNPESYTITDLARESLVNVADDTSFDAIILEGDELGSFKQEDSTTVAGTFGDDILLEDHTGFGVGDKLILEKTFISLEDSVGTGEIPFSSYNSNIIEPYTYPSDIYVNANGKLTNEADYDFIVYDTAADANDQIVLEDGTDIDLYISAVAAGVSTQVGFSGTSVTFDSASTWDILKL